MRTNDSNISHFETIAVPQIDSLYTYAHWMTGSGEDASTLVRDVYQQASRMPLDHKSEEDVRIELFQILRSLVIRNSNDGGRESQPSNEEKVDSGANPNPEDFEGLGEEAQESVRSFLESIIGRSIRAMPEECGSAIVF